MERKTKNYNTGNKKSSEKREYTKKGYSDKPYERKNTKPSDRPYEKKNTKSFDKPFEKKSARTNDKPKFQERPRRYEQSQVQEPDFDENINLIEGRNPVLEALKSGREIDKLFVQKGAAEGSIRQIIAIAKEKNILIKEVDKKKLDTLSSTQAHQGVIASAALYKYYEVDEILQIAADKNEDPFVIILDEITDNTNLGSILRISDAAGVHGIIIPKRRSASLTPVIAKTSAGAIEYVPVSKVTNITQTIEYLKKKGLWIAGADMSGDTYYKKDLSGPIALVIGSEGEGMGRLIKESCDFLVSIPMKGKISSLNAAVSTGIIVYEINKQRLEKQIEGSTH